MRSYPNLPYFMYGHSMGSFIARDYIAKYGDELKGVTLCGTCGVFASLPDTLAALQAAVDAGKGDEADPSFVTMLFGFMFARIEEPVKLGNEWICHSPWVQNDHAADPFDAFTKPTNNFAIKPRGASGGILSKPQVCRKQAKGGVAVMRKRLKWLIPGLALLLLIGAFLVYVGIYYRADETALAALASDESVQVITDEMERLIGKRGAVADDNPDRRIGY